ncbi:MAG: hypothetical protein H6740_07595 [Alphaproteobacteria bacterium]|nr:hypothetical protein [Alphaproteobacteria bacterium]
MLSLLLALSLGAPAFAQAAEPAPVEMISIQGWDMMRYSEHLIGISYRAIEQLLSTQDQVLAAGTPEAAEAWLTHARGLSDKALAQLAATPGWKGDRRMVEVCERDWRWVRGTLDKEFPELFALLLQQEVHNADLARADALMRELDAQIAANEATFQAEQLEFVRRHGAKIVESELTRQLEDTLDAHRAPSFSAPGIPPEGSALDGTIHVSFALRYNNMLIERQVTMMNALNAFMQATGGDAQQIEAARVEALTLIRGQLSAARAAEDWQGDASLRGGLVTFGEALERTLDKDFAEYTALLSKKRLNQKDIDTVNGIAEAADVDIQAAIHTFGEAEAGFQERWGILAYQAWSAQQPQ